MMRFVASTLFLGLISVGALAQGVKPPAGHLTVFRSEQSARENCPNDTIVWANTRTHTLYLRGDNHFAHTLGGFACESEARAHGYRGPTAHT
jgi:hypothetical protein